MRYAYVHHATEGATGYFSCEPEPRLGLAEALLHLCRCPYDSFMRRYILALCAGYNANEVVAAVSAVPEQHPLPLPLCALLHELMLLQPQWAEALQPLLPEALRFPLNKNRAHDAFAVDATPLVLLRVPQSRDDVLHRQWAALFSANRREHRKLPAPEDTGFPALSELSAFDDAAPFPVTLAAPHLPEISSMMAAVKQHADALPLVARPPAQETAALALKRLEAAGIIAGQEMRHTASLSPVGLLRPWHVRINVAHQRHAFSLAGTATTYGRGTSLDAARASCLMEMVERASLYVSVSGNALENRLEPSLLAYGRRSELLAQGKAVLDLDAFPLDAPYADECLTWTQGHNAAGDSVYVPLQMATLFSNLDEPDLFDALGSTGIATGNTLAEAKLAALTEIIERDAEATTPFCKTACFTISAGNDELLQRLLSSYAACGIGVQFQTLEGAMGVPAFKCFVMSPKGKIFQGYGAGLNAKRALLSALTETPFPFPDGGPSGPVLRKLPVREYEALPNYSLGSAEADVLLLEQLFMANGRIPVYVVLTRADLAFPVVRAFVPGMELSAEDGMFSRVPSRLYQRYVASFATL